jgi:hypothetical protein
MLTRRLLMWCETVVAVAMGLYASYPLGTGIFFGHLDPRHGGVYPILFGLLILTGAVAFAIGAWGLKSSSRLGWLGQLFPVAAVSWVVWDVLSHPASSTP